MVKKGPNNRKTEILQIWGNDEELQFSEIEEGIEKTKDLKIGKRTIINYLNSLVEKGLLEKRVDKKRHTFYKISPGKGRQLKKKEDIKKDIDDPSLEWTPKSHISLEWGDLRVSREGPKMPFVPSLNWADINYSAILESEEIDKMKENVKKQFEETLEREYPIPNKNNLPEVSRILSTHFFNMIEAALSLDIFSNVKLKAPGITKEKKHFFKHPEYEHDIYAQVWRHLYDASLALADGLLREQGNMRDFLSSLAEDKKMILVVQLDLGAFAKRTLALEKRLSSLLEKDISIERETWFGSLKEISRGKEVAHQIYPVNSGETKTDKKTK